MKMGDAMVPPEILSARGGIVRDAFQSVNYYRVRDDLANVADKSLFVVVDGCVVVIMSVWSVSFEYCPMHRNPFLS